MDNIQEGLLDVLGEAKFGNAISIKNGSKTVVYRQRKAPKDVNVQVNRNSQKRAVRKRSNVTKEIQKTLGGRRTSAANESLNEDFSLAKELVEYVNSGGDMGNVNRMLSDEAS